MTEDEMVGWHHRQIIGLKQVVDSDDFNVIAEVFNCRAEDHTTDSSETIDADLNHLHQLLLDFVFYT